MKVISESGVSEDVRIKRVQSILKWVDALIGKQKIQGLKSAFIEIQIWIVYEFKKRKRQLEEML